MTLGDFRNWTKDLPDSAIMAYQAYDEGCAISTFDMSEAWIYRNEIDKNDIAIVMNPGEDYDERRP